MLEVVFGRIRLVVADSSIGIVLSWLTVHYEPAYISIVSLAVEPVVNNSECDICFVLL